MMILRIIFNSLTDLARAPSEFARGLRRPALSFALTLLVATGASAETASVSSDEDRGGRLDTSGERPEEIRVVGFPNKVPRFLPAVEGAKIYAGKKTAVIDPDEAPQIVNDNYRQVLSRTPGLILSEEASPLVSIGYRGLDPQRTQFTMVLKDGIPIAADIFGYPENYYLPPIDSLEQIDFVHGGASLLYGPQPGGSLNFVTRKPPADEKFSLYSNQTFGSNSFYSTYNSLSGTVDRLGYDAYYYQKQGLGFREANSDFALYTGSANVAYAIDDRSRVRIGFDGYSEGHGEPGGLRLTEAPNAVLYQVDRNASSRFFNRFQLERYVGSVRYEIDLTRDTYLRATAWGGSYRRYSRRQRGGGFGTLPSGAAASTNAIQEQIFRTAGLDVRVRHDWSAWGETHTLATGAFYYFGDSPRVDQRGASPDARSGVIRNKSLRTTNYGAIFAENRFVFGDLSLIPAVRLENYAQSVDEQINVEKTAANVPLQDESRYDFVPLVGMGATYTLDPTVEVYANASSGYRPALFTQAVPTSPTTMVPGNLDPATSWQYELGFRGDPAPFASWDTSFFLLDLDNQIGSVQRADGLTDLRNVGRSRHMGWDLAVEAGALGLWDWSQGTRLVERFGEVSLFGNIMVLDARFIAGPLNGNTPAYAPDYVVRAGAEYSLRDTFRAQLLSTVSAAYFANANNTQDFFVPSYNVWDLTMEGRIYEDVVSLYFGVNNLFNENYWARVRSDGIEPAYERNFYGGVKIFF